MTKVSYSTLSQQAKTKADKEGRHVGKWVYGTKKQAGDARSGPKGSQPKPRRNAGPPGPRRVSEIVILDFGLASAETMYGAIALNGDNAWQALADLLPRHPKIVGARVQAKFPLTEGTGRFAVATVRKVSEGDKTPADLATVRGSQLFNSTNFLEKWVAVRDIGGPVAVLDDAGNSILAAEDHRIVLVSVQMSSAPTTAPEFKLHVTVQLDAVSSGASLTEI